MVQHFVLQALQGNDLGVTHYTVMSSDGKDWTLCWFHVNYFIRQDLFQFVFVAHFRKKFKETEHTFFVLLILQKHNVVLLLQVYTNESKPFLVFQMMHYSYLSGQK